MRPRLLMQNRDFETGAAAPACGEEDGRAGDPLVAKAIARRMPAGGTSDPADCCSGTLQIGRMRAYGCIRGLGEHPTA